MPEIATNRSVDRSDLENFVRARHHGVLLTTRRDGRPQASLVTMGLDDDGRIVVSSYPERAKVHNIRRDPTVSMVVLSDDFGGEWVQVDGAAEVIDLPDAVEPLVEYFRVIPASIPTGTSTGKRWFGRASVSSASRSNGGARSRRAASPPA
jgi:PPOX class probable F420-dependent enzyme